jgi:hypothetical protein
MKFRIVTSGAWKANQYHPGVTATGVVNRAETAPVAVDVKPAVFASSALGVMFELLLYNPNAMFTAPEEPVLTRIATAFTVCEVGI